MHGREETDGDPFPWDGPRPAPDPTGSRIRAAADRTRGLAQATGRRTTSAARTTRARIRKVTHAEGAGESGLAKLIELHAVSAAGDALIAVSLAGTLFFSVPTGEARGKVALYLLITMAPFVLLAPVIGPILDRFGHGRRAAIAGSFALRAFVAWVMGGAVAGGGIELYPAAFAALIGSKAYILSRSTCLPRLLPPQISLVKANSRISLAGVAGVAIGTPIGAGLAWFGSQWSLRMAFVVMIAGTILAAMLPRAIDDTEGEVDARILSADQLRDLPVDDEQDYAAQAIEPTLIMPREPERKRRAGRLGNVGAAVVLGLRANAAIRAMSGFLTIFLLFLVREEPLGALSSELSVGVLGVAAVTGSLVGSVLGARLRAIVPEPIIISVLTFAAVSSLITAIFYAVGTAVLVGLAAALAQQLGKLALDAQIQRDVPEEVRASAFARSETVVQLAWVLGGLLGIVVPLDPRIGLSIVAVGTIATTALVGRSFVILVREGRTRRQA